MQAHARVAVEAADGAHGRGWRAVELRSAPPLTFRRTGADLHLVGTAAGPVAGDELRLDLRVGAGAALTVRSAGASIVLPGPPRAEPARSSLAVDVDVEAGAFLHWRPEPTILVRSCDHRSTVRVRLAAGATVVWREELVLGRHEEATGSVLQRVVVDDADGPVLRHDLAVGPAWPSSLGPAGVGDARAVGTLIVAGATLPPEEALALALADSTASDSAGRDVRAAILPADGPALVVAAVATRPGALVAVFDEVTEALASHPVRSSP